MSHFKAKMHQIRFPIDGATSAGGAFPIALLAIGLGLIKGPTSRGREGKEGEEEWKGGVGRNLL